MSAPNVPPPPAAPASNSNDKTLMLVLAYLFPLSLIPLLTEKNDPEVQWHSKHGIVLGLFFCAVWGLFTVFGAITFGIGWVLSPILFIAMLVIVVLAIVKATGGQRLILPGITPFVDKL